jgi:hypothetical protein
MVRGRRKVTMERISMKRYLCGLTLMLAVVPLAACNQQQNKAPVVHERGAGGGGHGLRKACAADLEKFCAGQERGRERRECLQSHLDQLSSDCKAAVQARGEGRRRREF